jgi:transposase
VILEGSTVQSHKRRGTGHEGQGTILGLDVHAETIAVAIAEADGEVRSLGTIANRAESIRKLVKKLGPVEQLKACYEAGPTGYVLYWQLAELGVACEVIAPTLVPMKAGDRVKTDRRDAERLARSHRSGDLTAVWVPDEGSEALRDLVRAREAAKADQLRARHRLSKFLLRTGRRPETKIKLWTGVHMTWVRQLRFEHPAQESTRLDYLHEVEHMAERVLRLEQAITDAIKLATPEMQEVIRDLQALRGIAEISAVTIVSELGTLSRFENARQLMGYSGAVPSENSSGKRVQRGSITKAGNAHLRRIAVEAAWSYRLRPGIGPRLRKRQENVPEEIKEIAWKAQIRLTKRYARLAAAGKDQRKIVTAVGRELLGFIWAIGIKAESAAMQKMAA